MSVMQRIHQFLDASKRRTYVYERAAFLALEVALLVACAVPTIVGWRSGVAALIVGCLRLYEAELRREEASVTGRHKELGGVADLPPEKVARAASRTRALEVVGWLWPILTTMVASADAGRLSAGAALGVGATIVRWVWSRRIMPRWRASRLAWRMSKE